MRRALMLSVHFRHVVAALLCSACSSASAVTIDLVHIGNAGNAADTTGYGAVSYEYKIGKYEVTIAQWVEFLNVAAKSDPYGLFNPTIAGPQLVSAGITRAGSDGDYVYSVMENPIGQSSANRPLSHVSFFQAARFANWLHNGQGAGSTETGAYRLVTGDVVAATRANGLSTYTTSGPTNLSIGDQVSVSGFTDGGSLGTRFNLTGVVTGFPAANQFTMVNTNGNATAMGVGKFTGVSPTHAADAKYWVPSEDEWYKAAYYNPTLNGGAGGYFPYATQSSSPPGQTIGSLANQANWSVGGIYAVGPTPLNVNANYLTDVGSYSGSPGAYGTFDMTGNVREWTGTITTSAFSTLNSPASDRVLRGGGWTDGASRSTSAYRDSTAASAGFSSLGLRLAAPVTPLTGSLPGDFNVDGIVNAADFTVWRDNVGGDPAALGSNGNGDSIVDILDYNLWKQNYGATIPAASVSVPEPSSLSVVNVVVIVVAVGAGLLRCHRP